MIDLVISLPFAAAFASMVLPVPGLPCNSTPVGQRDTANFLSAIVLAIALNNQDRQGSK